MSKASDRQNADHALRLVRELVRVYRDRKRTGVRSQDLGHTTTVEVAFESVVSANELKEILVRMHQLVKGEEEAEEWDGSDVPMTSDGPFSYSVGGGHRNIRSVDSFS